MTISVVGAKPRITAPQSGSASAIWMAKQAAITPSSVTMKASIQRKPRFCSHRTRNTSSAVMITPISSGMPNRRLSPIAVPITSARSVAQIAISASTHSGHDTAARKSIAAGLREIAPRGDAKPRAQRLQQDRHQVGEQRDGKQRVTEFGAAGERRRPVAGIHVADRDQIAGAEKRQELAPERTGRAGRIEPKTSASGGRPRWRRQPAGSAITDGSDSRMHRERPEKSNRFARIYLVANNLQLHNAWNLSDPAELSGRLWPVLGFRPQLVYKARSMAGRHENPSRSALLCVAGYACGEPGLPPRAAKGPSEAIFVAQLVVLMMVGRLLGEAMLRLRQPAVMGQLIAGLLLGPSLFGLLLPDVQHALFPEKPRTEGDDRRGSRSSASCCCCCSPAWKPISSWCARPAAPSVYRLADGHRRARSPAASRSASSCPNRCCPIPSKRLITSLFLGTALSIASVKIVAMVVREMNFMRRTVGQVILASAIIDDSVGWIIVVDHLQSRACTARSTR